MAARCSYMKSQIEPGRLVMEARSIGSVRLSLMISELNHGQAAEADASPGAYHLTMSAWGQ